MKRSVYIVGTRCIYRCSRLLLPLLKSPRASASNCRYCGSPYRVAAAALVCVREFSARVFFHNQKTRRRRLSNLRWVTFNTVRVGVHRRPYARARSLGPTHANPSARPILYLLGRQRARRDLTRWGGGAWWGGGRGDGPARGILLRYFYSSDTLELVIQLLLPSVGRDKSTRAHRDTCTYIYIYVHNMYTARCPSLTHTHTHTRLTRTWRSCVEMRFLLWFVVYKLREMYTIS